MVSALKLKGPTKDAFSKGHEHISPAAIGKLFKPPAQSVHLFMGTHIEPVAGACLLVDLPPLP